MTCTTQMLNPKCQQLETIVAQQAAVIEQMREALQYHIAQTRPIFNSIDAIALQPCPEVLNKVRAEAVMKFFDRYRKDDFAHIHNVEAEHYAQRIEQGET